MRHTLFLVLFLLSCDNTTSRFTPIAEDIPIPRRDAPETQEPSTQHLIGALPTTETLSIRCLPVDAYGKTSLPAFGPRHPIHSYADDLVCLVTLPKRMPPDPLYERLRLEIRGETSTTPIVDMAAKPRPDGSYSYLLWLPANLWRKSIGALPTLQIDALVSCKEENNEEENNCQQQFSQTYTVIEGNLTLPDAIAKPKDAGPLLQELICYRSNSFGEPEEALQDATTLPLGGVLCALTLENPNETELTQAVAELRLDNPSPSQVAQRVVPTLAPKSRITLHLYTPDPGPNPGTLTLKASVGRNNTERSKASKSLSVTLSTTIPQASESQPTSQQTNDQK